jgi:hypothetical protein
MKIRPLPRFLQDDYPTAGSWFYNFLGNLNLIIDTLNPLVQGNIDTFYNIQCERQTVTLSHATAIQIKLQTLTAIPRFVRVGYAAGYVGVAAITSYNTDGTFDITVYFQGTAPTAAVATMLIFEP